MRRRLSALALLVLLPPVASSTIPGPAAAAGDQWAPLGEATGHTLAVGLDDHTAALISVGGADEATIYDQRRTDAGVGPRTEVVRVPDAESCRPVDAATSIGNVAVAVECLRKTGLEDPPTTLVELVWTADDGWVWKVLPEGELGSLDHSPQGQYVLFTSNSRYGKPHHVTSYHADLGWRDLTRRERGFTGDDMVAAINDSGGVVALRGAGFEDEPGYWSGGRLRIETYDDVSRTWTRRLTRSYRSGGIDPVAIDMAAGRLVATVVRARSTGRLHARDEKLLVLSGRPGRPRTWAAPRWSRQVLAAPAATTQAGVGVVAWQAVAGRRTAKAWLATWAPGRPRPTVRDTGSPTTLTDAVAAGRALDLSVSATGHGALAHVGHVAGDDHATVTGSSFDVGPRGGLTGRVDATWSQPVSTAVTVVAGETASSITLGTVSSFWLPAPDTRYSLGP